MNLKELTHVKEFIEDIIECLCQADELLAEELAFSEGPDGASDDTDPLEPAGEGVGTTDVPQDPLAEARVQLARAMTDCAEILDITEPYRKKYDAARIQAQGGPKTPLERVRALAQGALESNSTSGKEVKNGQTKKGRYARRQLPRA